MNKNIRVVVLLDQSQRDLLEEARQKMARSQGAIIRMALRDFFNKIEKLPRHEAVLLGRE